MRFIRLTIKYLRAPLLPLVLLNLPAAVLLGLFTRPMSTLTFVPEYLSVSVRGFGDMFWLIFSRGALTKIYPAVLIGVFLLLGISACFALVERHFRTGKLSIVAALKQINSYFLPVLIALIIVSAMMLLYSLIQTGLLTLCHFLISGQHTPALPGLLAAQAVALVLYVPAVLWASSTAFLPPVTMLYGYSFSDAYTCSFRMLGHNTGGVLVGLLFPTLTVALLQNAVSLLGLPYAANAAVACVLYLFILVYLVPFIMTTMFDLSGMERRDRKKFY